MELPPSLSVTVALFALLLILLLLGAPGVFTASMHFLWWSLALALILWLVGFFIRVPEGGGRWYRW